MTPLMPILPSSFHACRSVCSLLRASPAPRLESPAHSRARQLSPIGRRPASFGSGAYHGLTKSKYVLTT
eukprot:744082-Pleurochrysis_carterae.AAC.1